MFNYYKVAGSTSDGSQVKGAINREKYIIVHNQDDVWHLKNPEVIEGSNELKGIRTELYNYHLFYQKVEGGKKLNYNPNDGNPANEVHIYISEYAIDDLNNVVIPIGSINRLDVYDKSVGKNIFSYFVAFWTAYFGIAIIVSLISIASY